MVMAVFQQNFTQKQAASSQGHGLLTPPLSDALQ